MLFLVKPFGVPTCELMHVQKLKSYSLQLRIIVLTRTEYNQIYLEK